MNEAQDYGERLDKKLEPALAYNLPPGIDVDCDTMFRRDDLFWLGVLVERGLIGDTFEECKP